MSILRRQGKIYLLFVIVASMWKTGGGNSRDGKYFCNKFANAKPSSPFSFDKLLNLQGFTNLKSRELTMVADDYACIFYFDDMSSNRERLQINQENYCSPWLKESKKNILFYAAKFDQDPSNRLNMAYYLFLDNELYEPDSFVLAVNEKSITCMDIWKSPGETVQYFSNVPKIKLLTSLDGDQFSIAYVISQVPGQVEGEIEKGLIIYRSEVENSSYQCIPNLINNSTDLESKPYYYLALHDNPAFVLLVHPKAENLDRGKLYPLAERVMPGYLFAKSLFLFDVDLGCVYIIPDWMQFDWKANIEKPKDIQLSRINVPFEKFFVCPGVSMENTFSFLSSNRCETTIFSKPFNDDANLKGILGDKADNVKRTSLLIVTILAVICIFVICLFRIRQQKKNKRKSENINISDNTNKNGKNPNQEQEITKSTANVSLKKGRISVPSVVGGRHGHKSSKMKSTKSITTTFASRTKSSKTSNRPSVN